MIINKELKKQCTLFPNQAFEVVITLKEQADAKPFEDRYNVKHLGMEGFYSITLTGQQILDLGSSKFPIESIEYDAVTNI